MNVKTTAGKKLICILLTAAILICMMPSLAFASAEDDAAQKTVSVDITAQAEGSFLMAPQENVDVADNLAESYGFTDKVSDGVSALDVLVKAHQLIFGDEFTNATAADYLTVSDSGWISKVYGIETSAFNFAVDGDYPYDPDSSYSSIGGYTGYMITEAPVKDGGKVEFFINQDTDMYFDFYTYFQQEGQRVTEIKAEPQEEIELNVTGYIFAFGGPFVGQDRVNNGMLGNIADAQIGLVNVGTGEVTSIEGKVTDLNGNVKVSFDKAGTYYLTACGTEQSDHPLYMTLLKVSVEAEPVADSLIISQGSKTFELEPEFDPHTYEYDMAAPDYVSQVKATVTKAEGLKAAYHGYNSMFGSFGWSSNINNCNITKEWFGICIGTSSTGLSSYPTEYKINVKQYPTLSDMTVDGILDKDFDRDTMEYHVYVDGEAEGADIKATGYKGTYKIKIGGNDASSGETYNLEYDWKGQTQMEVPVEVSYADGSNTSTYKLVLEKTPKNDLPFIVTQPQAQNYIKGDEAEPLTALASANGELSYQWYENSENSKDGAKAIEGANAASYTPGISEAGTTYYFCRVTNTDKTADNVTDTNIVYITVDEDPTPVVKINESGTALPTDDGYDYLEEKGFLYDIGDTASEFTVTATSKAEGGVYSYQWYRSNSAESHGGLVLGQGESCKPDTSAATPKGYYYTCKVTYTFKGKDYVGYSEPETNPYVYVKATEAEAPEITKQPASNSYLLGETPTALSVSAKRGDGGTLTYQWYENDSESTEGAQPIDKATSSSYKPAASSESGTSYYYCVVTNTLQKFKKETVSDIAAIEFKSIEEVVGDTFEGKGTEEEPYLLSEAEDLDNLASLVNDGVSFKGNFFKVTNNIDMSASWDGIGANTGVGSNGANLNPFSGTIDGGGNTLKFASGSKPLFNYVRYAKVENLSIYAEYIPYNGLVANYVVDYGSDGSGSGVEIIDIDNVTIKSGSVIKGSGFIGGYASGGNTVNISGCTVEEGVKIGWDNDTGESANRSRIGSFGGDFNGTVTNSKSAATVYGSSYVGGIAGGKGQTIGPYSVQNCSFTGEIIATGSYVGGIAGGGYSGSMWGVASAPNTPCTNIENCYVDAKITGKDCVGGILGGEEGSTQAWGKAYVRNNCFAGQVNATDGNAGGIIGYMNSLNVMNVVENNYYPESAASKGIGKVAYIDTDNDAHETGSGTKYFDTSKDLSSQELPAGVNRTDHNRSDDPQGADKEKLAKGMTAAEMTSGEVTEALNNGENSFKNWVQGETSPKLSDKPVAYKLEVSGEFKNQYFLGEELNLTGAVVKATFSDGTVKEVALADIEIEGYNKDERGVQYLTLRYGAASANIEITVLKPDAGKITVYLSVLGDTPHKDGDEVHTLSGGNLITWVNKTAYEVDANATVLDVLTKAAEENGFTFKNPTGNYITEVTYKGETVGEFTNGDLSGWLFTLNGAYGDLGVCEQFLEDGDIVTFHYTDDYSKENWTQGATAAEVIKMIDALPEVGKLTLSDAAAVAKANDAFESLSDEDKALISEVKQNKLKEAVLRIAELKKEAASSFNEAYETVGEYLEGQVSETPQYGDEWAVIGLARAGKLSGTAIEAYYKNIVAAVKANGSAKLDKNKATENARVILALTSIGKDVTDVGGYNLLEPLADMNYVTKQGINGTIFTLLAFDSHDYKIPKAGSNAVQTTREALTDSILSAQLDDGGWALSGDKADPDITAMALQSLAPYMEIQEVKAAVDKALACLSALQNEDGGFSSWGTSNSESCAQVITALTALGIDPATDIRFIKGGNSVLDALMGFYTGTGFEHVAGGGLNNMATDQAYYAMVSYDRMSKGQTSLYDMSDVTIKTAGSGENGSTSDENGTGEEEPKNNYPSKTGDDSRIAMWMALALAGGAGTVLLRRRNKDKKAA